MNKTNSLIIVIYRKDDSGTIDLPPRDLKSFPMTKLSDAERYAASVRPSAIFSRKNGLLIRAFPAGAVIHEPRRKAMARQVARYGGPDWSR